MAFTRRNTGSDGLYARAWTCDAVSDLTSLAALLGNPGAPHRGDQAFVTANSTWYFWTDDNTWRVFAKFPQAAAYVTSNQSMGNAVFTAVTFDTNDFDSDGIHSTSVNTSRFTVPLAGKYLCTFTARVDVAASGLFTTKLRINGTTDVNGGGVQNAFNASVALGAFYVGTVSLNTSDYIEFLFFQNSGAGVNLLAGANPTQFNPRGAVTYVAP